MFVECNHRVALDLCCKEVVNFDIFEYDSLEPELFNEDNSEALSLKELQENSRGGGGKDKKKKVYDDYKEEEEDPEWMDDDMAAFTMEDEFDFGTNDRILDRP